MLQGVIKGAMSASTPTWENSGCDGTGKDPEVKTGALWDTGVEAWGSTGGPDGVGGLSTSISSSPFCCFRASSPPARAAISICSSNSEEGDYKS